VDSDPPKRRAISPIHDQSDPVQTLQTSVHGAINMLDLARRTALVVRSSGKHGQPRPFPPMAQYWSPAMGRRRARQSHSLVRRLAVLTCLKGDTSDCACGVLGCGLHASAPPKGSVQCRVSQKISSDDRTTRRIRPITAGQEPRAPRSQRPSPSSRIQIVRP
jgi:hypothetical protein